jgi:hypothetical protein
MSVVLLTRVDSLEEDDDINRRNCIHRLVISIGREQPTTRFSRFICSSLQGLEQFEQDMSVVLAQCVIHGSDDAGRQVNTVRLE